MKLSTKGRYGTRAMLDLALHYGEGAINLKEIAERQQISERYLEHLILSLKTAGLVKSIRGSHGGFMLARPPADIKAIEIIEALEGPLCPVHCIDDPESCSRAEQCVTRTLWEELNRAMNRVLESRNLQDIVEQHRAKGQRDKSMYYI